MRRGRCGPLSWRQVLPSYDLEYLRQGGNRHDGPFIPWCAGSGLVTFLLVFFLWRPQKEVFVDRICIHQHETRLKTEGILNLEAEGIQKTCMIFVIHFDLWKSTLWYYYVFLMVPREHRLRSKECGRHLEEFQVHAGTL